MDEFELIRRYFDRAATADGVVLGIGDDGAVIEPAPGLQQVQVIDTLVEGVHFPQNFNPTDLGYRVVAVNLSDIAAMGAEPRWMTLALTLTSADDEWLTGFAEGLHGAAVEFGVALIGGDTTSGQRIVATVHVTGEVEPGKALTRAGAKPGDRVFVTGTVGDAAAGLDGLRTGHPVKTLVNRFSRPSPRVAYGRTLGGVATAAIDVSDGLLGDLGKLAEASGVGAEIQLERLPLSDDLRAHFPAAEQRRFALTGGDDYELCFTMSDEPPDPGILQVTEIGRVTETPGVVCKLDGELVDIDDPGYLHFQ